MKPLDGETFKGKEFTAWMNSEPKGAELRLRTKDSASLQSRVLGYARRRGNTITTERLNKNMLKITLVWI